MVVKGIGYLKEVLYIKEKIKWQRD